MNGSGQRILTSLLPMNDLLTHPTSIQWNFFIWGIFKAKIFNTFYQSFNDLKAKLILEWTNLLDEILHVTGNDVPK